MELIAEDAAKAFKKMFLEQAEKIEAGLVAAAEDAAANDTEAKLNVGFMTSILWDKDQLDYRLSFSVPHKLTASSKMPNPDQLEFPETQTSGGGSVTITGGGHSVTLTPEQMAAAAKKLQRKAGL